LASLTCCPSEMLGDIDQRVGLTQVPTPMELRFHFRFSGSGKVWQQCRLPSKSQVPLFTGCDWFFGTSLVACVAVFPRRVAFRVAVSQAAKLFMGEQELHAVYQQTMSRYHVYKCKKQLESRRMIFNGRVGERSGENFLD
jgi:hypothetical protein